MNTKSVTYLKWGNLLALIAMITVNVLAELLPIGGTTTAHVSDKYPSMFTPGGFTFSIWFLIYILLTVFVIGQLVTKDPVVTEKIGNKFILSCLFNIAWIVTWHYEMIMVSTLIIAALWVVLLFMARDVMDGSFMNKSVFGIYFAWITVATIAAIFIGIGYLKPEFFGSGVELVSCLLALALTTAIGVYMTFKYKNWPFALTVAWAMLGILIKQTEGLQINSVIMVVTLVAGIVILVYSINITADMRLGCDDKKI